MPVNISESFKKKTELTDCKWYWVSMGHFGETFEGITYLHPQENKGHGFQGSLLKLGAVSIVTWNFST